jgi:hypothetical protein
MLSKIKICVKSIDRKNKKRREIMPYKSFIEYKDIPTDGFVDMPAVLKSMKYGQLAQTEKPEVVVIKESFLLRNQKGNKVVIFTRSQKDHSSTVGDCSILLHGDFIKEESQIDNNGIIHYDVNDRLHEHLGSFSSIFSPAKTKKSTLVHYHNPYNNRKYIFIIFEMVCNDYPPPMFLKLKTRLEDAFIGMHDIKDAATGIRKYNKTPIDVDENVIKLVKPNGLLYGKDKSILNLDIKSSLINPNLTLFKVNLIGVG